MTDRRVICVSGYFDPLHVGHIEYIQKAKSLGDELVVIVNNDTQSRLKKGRPFMRDDERATILRAIRDVNHVVVSVDKDRTVRETLRTMEPRPTHFCNGGDQNNTSIPESDVCRELGIQLIEGLGDKVQSSSWLLAAHLSESAPDPR